MDALEQVVEREGAVLRHHDLAVEDKGVGLESEGCLDQVGEIARERAAGLGLENDVSSVAEQQTAKSVPFRLVLPATSGRDLVGRERLHRRKGRTQPASALSGQIPAGESRRPFSGARQRPRSEAKSGWECRATTKEDNGPLGDLFD